MKFAWWKMLALASLMLLAASPALAKTIKIAVAAPLTGDAAAYGDNVKAGVQMKVDEVNAKGGVKGDKIEVVGMDELCSPKEAATVSANIARDKEIVAVVGHVCSSAHLAALPTYVREGVPAISATATNVSISSQNKDKAGKVWSFRDVYRDDYQGQFLAKYAAKVLGLKKIAVFYENNDYGIGLKDAFTKQAKAEGLAIVGEESYVKGNPDFTPQLTKIKGQAPDGIFFAGYYQEGALIAGQAQKLGITAQKFGADGFDNNDYIKLAGPAAENTYLSVPFIVEVAGPEAASFIAEFKKRTSRDVDYMSANAYDAAGIVIKAIETVGADRAKIREYLAGMTTPEKGYKGVTGLTYFDANGDALKPAFVKLVKDGKFIPAPKQMN